MSEEKDTGSWADTENMDAEQKTSTTSDLSFLEEILSAEDFDARRAIDLVVKFMTPAGGN